MTTPLEHLELALGGNMNIGTLKPKAFAEIMEDYAKHYYKEQFETNKLKPSDKDLISKVKQNLQEINKDKKITDYNFDIGYALGFLDGNDFSRQIPELTLYQAIEKAKPNMDKIKDVDAHLNEIK